RAADRFAMLAQHVELAPDRLAAVRDVEHVAGVRVLRDEAQRAALAGAADQDRMDRRLLEEPLQALEALGHRREVEAEELRLLLEVARADAEPGAAAGQLVERLDGLAQERGRTVGDGGDHRPEPD